MTKRTKPGISVDAAGDVAYDPSANVLLLVEAANKRQDDLRQARNQQTDAALQHAEQLALVRENCSKELAALRQEHAKEMVAAETSRLNAIRQVDQLAVNTAADRAFAAIQALAETTASNADNVRTALTNAAAAIATQTQGTNIAITERISALEKASYEGSGKFAGVHLAWLVLLGLVALVSGLFGIAAVLYAVLKQ